MKSKSPVKYEPIINQPDGPLIRLLHLRPRRMDNDPIEIDVKTVPLSAKPRFEALSYVWGKAIRRKALKYKDGMLSVTENLFSALSELRHSDRDRVLWVDALCINQEDDDEKADQVGRMASIYQSAERTLIWLGPAAHRSDAAFEFVNKVFEQLRHSSPETWQLCTRDETYESMAVDFSAILARFEREAVQPPSEPGSDAASASLREVESHQTLKWHLELEDEQQYAFTMLMRRPWWGRVWVIQELCLSSEAMVCCGKYCVPWEAFHFALTYTNEDEDSALMQEHIQLQVFTKSRLGLKYSDDPPSLLQALSTFKWFQATDPRDKIYALLGISKSIGLRPDYKSSVEICYRETAKAILSSAETLDLLDHVVAPPSYNGSARGKNATWVPDWSYDVTTIPVGTMSPQLANLFPAAQDLTKQVEPLLESQVSFREDGHVLVLSGKMLDSIETLSETIRLPFFHPYQDPSIDFPDTWLETVLDGLRVARLSLRALAISYRMGSFIQQTGRLIRFAERALPGGGDGSGGRSPNLTQLVRTFFRGVADPEWDEHKAAETLYKMQDTIAESRLLRLCRRFGLHWILPPLYTCLLALEVVDHDEESDDDDEEPLGFLIQCIDHRPALTRLGRRFCTVPHTCRVGDQVALLRGGRHPYVVRPTGTPGRWTLVGPCYVDHAYMEALREEWRDGDAQEMEFA